MRSTGEPEGDGNTGGRQVVLECDAIVGGRPRAATMKVPHQVALTVAGDGIPGHQVVHPPAPIDGIDWDILVMHQRVRHRARRRIEQHRPPVKPPRQLPRNLDRRLRDGRSTQRAPSRPTHQGNPPFLRIRNGHARALAGFGPPVAAPRSPNNGLRMPHASPYGSVTHVCRSYL